MTLSFSLIILNLPFTFVQFPTNVDCFSGKQIRGHRFPIGVSANPESQACV